MTITASIETISVELAEKTFKEFCDGMAIMFDLKMVHEHKETYMGNKETLASRYTDISAAYSIRAKGSVNGTCYFVTDQRGIFTLPGLIVMHPEKRINENCTKGTLEDANFILDVVKELGNLLIGVFDKIAREHFQDNTHMLQTGTQVGNISEISENFLSLENDQEFYYVSHEVKINNFDPFVCGLIIPTSIFDSE